MMPRIANLASTKKKQGFSASDLKRSTDDKHPKFSLELVQPGFDVRDCKDRNDRGNLMMTLSDMSKMPWFEIKRLDRHKKGFETIEELRERLPQKLRDMTPIAFRFSDMKPVIGVRVEDVFYIVWIDHDMKLYKH